MESLAEKLRSLGIHSGSSLVTPKKNSHRIEDVIPGRWETNAYGEVFISESNQPGDYLHGNIPMRSFQLSRTILDWARIPTSKDLDLTRVVFLDTETTGLAGGTGTFIFLVGLGFFEGDYFHQIQLFSRTPANESAWLASLDSLLTSFSTVVTYNGKSFDIPILNTRHILNGFSSPFEKCRHIDLLHLSRRLWKHRVDDCSLKTLEGQILQFARAQEEVPGWMVPQIYRDYLHNQDARLLSGVFYHNAMDVLSLAALFRFVSIMFNQEDNFLGVHDGDHLSSARLHEDLGDFERALGHYKEIIENSADGNLLIKALHRAAHIHKSNGDLENARRLWLIGNGRKDIACMIELAKCFEHDDRDVRAAIAICQQAILVLERQTSTTRLVPLQQKDLLYRLERLRRKESRSSKSPNKVELEQGGTSHGS